MTDVPPMVKWTAAVIAGGGIAGLTQGLTGILRAHSTVLTGGLGNPVIATAELGGALLISFLALVAPAAAVALVILFLLVAIVCSAGYFEERNRRTARRRVIPTLRFGRALRARVFLLPGVRRRSPLDRATSPGSRSNIPPNAARQRAAASVTL